MYMYVSMHVYQFLPIILSNISMKMQPNEPLKNDLRGKLTSTKLKESTVTIKHFLHVLLQCFELIKKKKKIMSLCLICFYPHSHVHAHLVSWSLFTCIAIHSWALRLFVIFMKLTFVFHTLVYHSVPFGVLLIFSFSFVEFWWGGPE